MNKTTILGRFCFCAFLFPLMLLQAEPAGNFFNVRDFGAVGDGTNLDSPAIDKAIAAAAAVGGAAKALQ